MNNICSNTTPTTTATPVTPTATTTPDTPPANSTANTITTIDTADHTPVHSSTYRDSILESKGARPVAAFCKDYGWSVRKMNKWLGDHRMQYKRADKGSWIPSLALEEDGYVIMESGEHYVGNGYVELCCKNYWTPKGRLMIHDKLAEDGIYPIVDREKKY